MPKTRQVTKGDQACALSAALEFEIALSSSEVIFAFFKFVHSYSLALCIFTLFYKNPKKVKAK